MTDGGTSTHLAIDLGAESGRGRLGWLDGGRLEVEDVGRFATAQVPLPLGPVWDVGRIFAAILDCIRAADERASARNGRLETIGVDSWGVDFALVGRSGALLGLPHCYRDGRCDGPFARAVARVGRDAIYAATGAQFLPFNSLYRLMVHQQDAPEVVASAGHLLLMADLFHFLLSGTAANEATLASTSQMYDPRTGDWRRDLLGRLDLPAGMLAPVVAAGTDLGPLRPALVDELGLAGAPRVVTPAAHDTASAVAAVPAQPGSRWAFISSGTWSCLGAEIPEAVVTDAARDGGFANEEGVGRSIRFLSNMVGLWFVQEVRHALERDGHAIDYDELTALARDAEPFRTIIDTEHPAFVAPGDMPARLAHFARATGQPVPETPGAMVRACLEGLALSYRLRLEALETVLDRRFDVLHVVGGGARNDLLADLTAGAIDRPVIVGPFEATATGNLLIQMMGSGHLDDLAAVRRVAHDSAQPRTFAPRDRTAWIAHLARRRALPSAPENLA